jgi:hypothetical protein
LTAVNYSGNLANFPRFQIFKHRYLQQHFFDGGGFPFYPEDVLPLQTFRFLDDFSESVYCHGKLSFIQAGQ